MPQFKNAVITGGIETLYQHIAPGAFHNSSEQYDQPKCHPDTRMAVLKSIMNWVANPARDFPFLWIYGPAGAGKSAICRTIAEQCYYLKLLLANFCFSRTADGRNNAARLIATIAYQLALSIPSTRALIETVIEDDPSVFDRSIQVQIQHLIVDPIQSAFQDASEDEVATWPRLLLIDGLDECQDSDIQTYILETLVNFSQQMDFPIIILIASRPEHQIRSAFDIGQLNRLTTRLVLDDSFLPDLDIVNFLNSELSKITKQHPFRSTIPNDWPSHEVVQALVKKSSGQFIFAATVVKYVKSRRHRPADRLDVIMGLRPSDQDSPFADLDALYQHIFSSVLDLAPVLRILGFKLTEGQDRLQILNARLSIPLPQLTTGRKFNTDHHAGSDTFTLPEPACTIEQFLLLNNGDLRFYLTDLEDILVQITPDGTDIRILHASLGDFLVDPLRSGDFHVDLEKAHSDSSICYLRHLGLIKRRKNTGGLWNCFRYHLTIAFPTDELRREILQYDVSASVWSLDICNAYCGWRFLPEFLNSIQSSKFPDADALCAQIIEKLDDQFRLHLPKYHDDTRLRDLLVFVACGCTLPPPDFNSNSPHKLNTSWDTFQKELIKTGAFKIDDNSLRLVHFSASPSTEISCHDEITNPLREYLCDSRRSGEFHVDDVACAAMLHRCLQVFIGWLELMVEKHREDTLFSTQTNLLAKRLPELHPELHPELALAMYDEFAGEPWVPSTVLPMTLSSQYLREIISPLIKKAAVSKDLDLYIRQSQIYSMLLNLSNGASDFDTEVEGIDEVFQPYLSRCLQEEAVSSVPHPFPAVVLPGKEKALSSRGERNEPQAPKLSKSTNLGKQRHRILDFMDEEQSLNLPPNDLYSMLTDFPELEIDDQEIEQEEDEEQSLNLPPKALYSDTVFPESEIIDDQETEQKDLNIFSSRRTISTEDEEEIYKLELNILQRAEAFERAAAIFRKQASRARENKIWLSSVARRGVGDDIIDLVEDVRRHGFVPESAIQGIQTKNAEHNTE